MSVIVVFDHTDELLDFVDDHSLKAVRLIGLSMASPLPLLARIPGMSSNAVKALGQFLGRRPRVREADVGGRCPPYQVTRLPPHVGQAAAPSWGTPHVVARRLGHAQITTTLETYAHVLPDMSADAAAKLASSAASLTWLTERLTERRPNASRHVSSGSAIMRNPERNRTVRHETVPTGTAPM